MKYKLYILLTYFLYATKILGQADYQLYNGSSYDVRNANVLIDKNYSFDEILHNKALVFKKTKQISPKGIDYYWIKYTVQNNNAYDLTLAIWVFPPLYNTLYFFNENKQQWHYVTGGEKVSNNTTNFRYMPCVFKANKATTFYIKVQVTDFKNSVGLLKSQFTIVNQSEIVSSRAIDFNWWLITAAIVVAFFIYNSYWYFMIREKVYLYYLIILFAGLIYITCASSFLSFFTSVKSLNIALSKDGILNIVTTELKIMQLCTCVIIFGFVAFTRTYLNTKRYLPKWDKILLIAFYTFLIVALLSAGLGHFNVLDANDIYVHIINALTLIVVVLILIIGVKCYLQKRKEATYFLQALTLPLLIILTLIFFLLAFQKNIGMNYLPHLATLSITITFAIALVAKVNIIKNELTNEKIDKQLIANKIAIEKERNIRLEAKIESDKNEIEAAQKIKLLMKELHHRVKNNLQIVSSLLSLQSFRIKDQAAINAVREGQHRIEAMSLIHQRLYVQDNITQVNIKEFISDIAESLMFAYGYNYKNFELKIIVTEELLDVDIAIPISIIINELITNAFKYAYIAIEKPSLIISYTKEADNAALTVADNGVGINLDSWQTNDGYGKDLIQTFTKQINGAITLQIINGTTFKIVFPC